MMAFNCLDSLLWMFNNCHFKIQTVVQTNCCFSSANVQYKKKHTKKRLKRLSWGGSKDISAEVVGHRCGRKENIHLLT